MSTADSLFDNNCVRLGFDPLVVRQQLSNESDVLVINRYLFSLIDRPFENNQMAAGIVMYGLYKEAPLTVAEYAETFASHFTPETYQFLKQYSNELQEIIQFENDFNLTYFSVKTLIDTYLSRLNADDSPKEIPQFILLRVAVGQFHDEGLEAVIECYWYLTNQILVPSSPTFFNMGFKEGAPTSCMLFTMADDLVDIFSVLGEMAMASKANAGLGIDLQHLRHSSIGRQGKGKGIIPLVKLIDDTTEYVDQGGKRPGSGTVSIRDWNMDLMDFIKLTNKTGHERTRVNRLNTSIVFSNLFFKRLSTNGDWTVFCAKQAKELIPLYGPAFDKKYVELEEAAKKWNRYKAYKQVKYLEENKVEAGDYPELMSEFDNQSVPKRYDTRVYKAAEVMDLLVTMQRDTGMPYMIHGCRSNLRNPIPNVGTIKSSNLCQEILLPAVPKEQTASCNLCSLNLKAFVHDSKFNFGLLVQATRFAVRSLNKVIDRSLNVSEKVKVSNNLSRPLGVGVSGFAEMLYELGMPVVKNRKVNPDLDKLNLEIWSCMYHSALTETVDQAKRFGACPAFAESQTAKGKLQYHLVQEEEKLCGFDFGYSLEPSNPEIWTGKSWESLIEDIKQFGCRNMLLLSCQPTASTAQIIGNTESVELPSSNLYNRNVKAGEFTVLNYYMVKDLQKMGLWNLETYNNITEHNGSVQFLPDAPGIDRIKDLYITMWEVPQMVMVNLAAQRQIVIDHSQSMNLYIEKPDPQKLVSIHSYIHSKGLKTGIYYLRSKSTNKALQIGGKKIIDSLHKTNDKLSQLVKETEINNQKTISDKRDSIINEVLMTASTPMLCTKQAGCVSCE